MQPEDDDADIGLEIAPKRSSESASLAPADLHRIRRRVYELRRSGVSFVSIGAALGIPKGVARSLYADVVCESIEGSGVAPRRPRQPAAS